MDVTAPVFLFLESCVLGFLLGALYDVFRILRLSFPNGKVLIFFEDVFYFVAVTIASFTFIVVQNSGMLRAFLILGELLGAILYFFTLSILIMNAAHLIIKCVKAVLRFLYRITLRPLIRLICLIGRGFRKLGLRCIKQVKIVVRKPKKHLKQDQDVVYNDTKQSNGSEVNGKGKKAKEKSKKTRHS